MERYKIEKWLSDNFYNLVLFSLGSLNLFAFLAPLFSAANLKFISKPVYFIYGFFCHQMHWRSIHIFDKQIAWCTRDTFIWLSIFITAILVKKYNVKGIRWYSLFPFIIPIALDGGVQTIATVLGLNGGGDYYYISNNFMRMVTGTIFGTGIGLWIMPMLRDNLTMWTKFDDERA